MNDLPEIDDNDIPESAYTGPAPVPRQGKGESKGESKGNHPTGPACPECGKDDEGREVQCWENKTKNGRPYFRCSRCGGCWWPMKDKPNKIDASSKWPPLPKKGE